MRASPRGSCSSAVRARASGSAPAPDSSWRSGGTWVTTSSRCHASRSVLPRSAACCAAAPTSWRAGSVMSWVMSMRWTPRGDDPPRKEARKSSNGPDPAPPGPKALVMKLLSGGPRRLGAPALPLSAIRRDRFIPESGRLMSHPARVSAPGSSSGATRVTASTRVRTGTLPSMSTTTVTAREVHLVRRPSGIPEPDDFAFVDRELARAGRGRGPRRQPRLLRRSLHARPDERRPLVRGAVRAERGRWTAARSARSSRAAATTSPSATS